jgi:hypothetical protein
VNTYAALIGRILRAPVIGATTADCLDQYLGFRHVVRNAYTFNLRPERVRELTRELPACVDALGSDLNARCEFSCPAWTHRLGRAVHHRARLPGLLLSQIGAMGRAAPTRSGRSVAVLASLVVAACAAPGQPGSTGAGTSPIDPPAAAVTGEAAYPLPMPTQVPTPGLANTITGLAPGLRPRLGLNAKLDLGMTAARFHLVPVEADAGTSAGGPIVDVVVVRSDGEGSEQVLSLAEVLGEPITGNEVREGLPETVVQSPSGPYILHLALAADDDRQVRADLILPLAGTGLSTERYRMALRWLDWTGDGVADPLLAESGGKEPAKAAVYVLEQAPMARLVATMAEHDVLLDLDADGATELIVPDDAAGWLARHWDGSRFDAGTPVTEEAIAPATVRDDALPALPANLVFGRDGVRYVWPATGGTLRELTRQPDQLSGVPAPTEFTHGGTSRIAYLERRPDESGVGGTSRQWLVIHDVGTGERVDLQSWPEDLSISELAISGDGRWVTYLDPDCDPEAGAASVPQAAAPGLFCRGTYRFVGVDGGSPRSIATCRENEARSNDHTCSSALPDPHGARLAWGDDTGLWLADLPDGPPLHLAEGQVIDWEAPADPAAPEPIPLQWPERWSPDGRWLLTYSVAGIEGGVLRLWDMDVQREVGAVGFCYVGCRDQGWNRSSSSSDWPLIETSDTTRELWLRSTATQTNPHSGVAELGEVELDPLLPPSRADGFDDAGLAALGWSPGPLPAPFGAIVTPSGQLTLAVRHPSDRRFRGNALLTAAIPPAPGTGPMGMLWPVIRLPGSGRELHQPASSGRTGTLRWSTDAGAWLFTGPRPGTEEHPYGMPGYTIVGLMDGSAAWDASDLLADATDIAWVPDQ